MRLNAISLANYFVTLAKSNNVDLKQFGLIKRVYIAHGFSLAILERSVLDPRFDTVEAWKYGPVIPSVYHSFKHNQGNPITEPSIIVTFDAPDNFGYEIPELTDMSIKKIADMVWNRYLGIKDSEMIELTHRPGTPWALCYEEGKSNSIPDYLTKAYYSKLIVK